MNCPDFETIIIEIARDRLMDAATRERGLEHVRSCASCATLLGEERALSSDLRALSSEGADEEIPERIETALLAAFRQRDAAPASAPIVATRNHRRALAVAALALLAFGLALAGLIGLGGLKTWTASSPKRESPARGSSGAGGASTPAVVSTPEKTTRPSPVIVERRPGRSIASSAPEKRPRRPAKTTARRRPANDIVPSEFVTQFFPVMQGGELIPLESGRIVRVRMPRSNLIPLGIPFNQERANETINADVLLSNDGLARAIRLVY
jgi:hypothetical protein